MRDRTRRNQCAAEAPHGCIRLRVLCPLSLRTQRTAASGSACCARWGFEPNARLHPAPRTLPAEASNPTHGCIRLRVLCPLILRTPKEALHGCTCFLHGARSPLRSLRGLWGSIAGVGHPDMVLM
eukprot:5416399-Prymnesium_polylepis.1